MVIWKSILFSFNDNFYRFWTVTKPTQKNQTDEVFSEIISQSKKTGEKDHDKAISYGKEWLESIGEGSSTMTANECQFCHSQGAPEPVEQAIKEKGYFIQKMEGCP